MFLNVIYQHRLAIILQIKSCKEAWAIYMTNFDIPSTMRNLTNLTTVNKDSA